MIKNKIVIICGLMFPFYAFSQTLEIRNIETIKYKSDYYCSVYTLKDSVKYYECFRKEDSTLWSTFTTVNDKRFGIENTYYATGKLASTGCFINDSNVGVEKKYYDNGEVESVGEYKFIGINKTFIDTVEIEDAINPGTIIASVEHYKSPKEGKWIYYSSNGKKYSQGRYKNNKRVGVWLFYNINNGKIADKRNY